MFKHNDQLRGILIQHNISPPPLPRVSHGTPPQYQTEQTQVCVCACACIHVSACVHVCMYVNVYLWYVCVCMCCVYDAHVCSYMCIHAVNVSMFTLFTA